MDLSGENEERLTGPGSDVFTPAAAPGRDWLVAAARAPGGHRWIFFLESAEIHLNSICSTKTVERQAVIPIYTSAVQLSRPAAILCVKSVLETNMFCLHAGRWWC